MTRRDLLAAAAQLAVVPAFPPMKVDGLDKAVDGYIDRQILDKSHKYYGIPDGQHPAAVAPFQERPRRRAHGMAAQAFGRIQTKDGNWNLPTTNFNSPPDTAFIMQGVGVTLMNARQCGFPELEKWLLPAVERAGVGRLVQTLQ